MNDAHVTDLQGKIDSCAQAADAPKKPNRLKSVFNFAAKMTGRMALTTGLKIAGGSLAVGFGASALGAAAVGVLLAGVGSAAITCYTNRHESKETRRRRTLMALGCGVAFGVLGAWFAQTDLMQPLLDKAQSWFAGADIVPKPSVADVAAAPVAAPVVDTVLPVALDSPAVDPLAAGLAYADIPSADGVSAQALKDAAHDVLRMEDIAAGDRVDMARALAQEAAERGNSQAVTFLTDLPKVEAALGLEPQVAEPVIASAAPVAAPEVNLAPEASAAPVFETSLPSPDDAADLALAAVTAPAATLSETFSTQAASCVVTVGDGAATDVSCTIIKDVMAANDQITFTTAGGVSQVVTLDGSSVSVQTSSMLNATLPDAVERVVAAKVKLTVGL